MMDVAQVQANGRFLSNTEQPGERSLFLDIIFVESQRIPSIGTTVTVSLGEPTLNPSQNWKAAKGTVRWICPAIDNFGFSRGFAVQINGSRCGTSEKAVEITARAPVESIHAGQRIMGRLGRTWKKPLPRYEVLGVFS